MIRIVLVLTTAICLASAAQSFDPFEGAPAVPPGFDDYKAAQAAVLTGKVPSIDTTVEVPDSISMHKDIVYASHDGVDVKIDVFVPKDSTAPPPVLVFIHGGGWSGGKKEDYLFYNVHFAELGYATASVQYRLAPKHQFPKAVHDVNCAIAWLRANGPEYGFDGKRMALLGGSAGGHLSLLAGYGQDAALACPEQPESVKQRVQAIVNLYGVVDCTTERAINAPQVKNFIGKTYEDAKDLYVANSPLFHLDKDDPPTLTFHGTIDELVPISQADRLHEKLDELGIPNYYDRVEGWPHTMDLAKPINDRCRYVTERFLAEYLPLD